MSYQIGQKVKANIDTSFLIKQSYNIHYGDNPNGTENGGIALKGYGTTVFYDFAISLSDKNYFDSNQDYYLRFTIKRNDLGHEDPQNNPNDIKLTLRLIKDSTGRKTGQYQLGEYQTLDSEILFYSYIDGTNERYTGYETIFRPNNSQYKYLVFTLSRNVKDYNTAARSIYTSDDDRNIYLDEYIPELGNNRSAGDLCTITNILGNIKAEKIGIQTNPGTLICVNHEPIRVGRSGIYEVNNGVKITSVGICAPDGDESDNINDFILDYAYDSTNG